MIIAFKMDTPIALSHTVEFVKEFLSPNAKILEVGCGDGRLATQLMKEGYQVIGIDISPEKIEAAKRNGAQAEVADILHFESKENFDAALFTHSLHHIHLLDAAMNKAKTLLGERGRILIEDFAIEQMDEKTADWFYHIRDIVYSMAGNPPGEEKTGMERWKIEHEHTPPLHTQKAMLGAMERRFGNLHSSKTPYLYRYFVHSCEGFPNGSLALKKIFDWEKTLIEKGLIQAIGLRISAKKYFSYLK